MNKIVRLHAANRRISDLSFRNSVTARRSAGLVCAGTPDPATGRLVCRWRTTDGVQSADDRPCTGRDDAGRTFGLRVAA
jgi:hypothetical protein